MIYPAVREECDAGGKLEDSVLYQYYCWLERHLQRYKYSGRYGLQPYHAQDRARLEKSLESAPAELKPGLEYPDYYTRIDIHQHPGGVWSDPIAESARLLKPGGRMAHLDFLPADDDFARLIHFGHARRNNEPYMEPLARMDLPSVLKRLGFKKIEIMPFEEAEGTLAPGYAYWRFPWTLIAAER